MAHEMRTELQKLRQSGLGGTVFAMIGGGHAERTRDQFANDDDVVLVEMQDPGITRETCEAWEHTPSGSCTNQRAPSANPEVLTELENVAATITGALFLASRYGCFEGAKRLIADGATSMRRTLKTATDRFDGSRWGTPPCSAPTSAGVDR